MLKERSGDWYRSPLTKKRWPEKAEAKDINAKVTVADNRSQWLVLQQCEKIHMLLSSAQDFGLMSRPG